MNLRHVNIVSQSYIGNTALLYTFKTKMGWSKPNQNKQKKKQNANSVISVYKAPPPKKPSTNTINASCPWLWFG